MALRPNLTIGLPFSANPLLLLPRPSGKVGAVDHRQEKSAGPNARAERVLGRVHVKHATRLAGVKRDSQPTDAMSSL